MIKISNKLIISSGVIIISHDKKILLIKPKGLEKGHFSLPKGMRNQNESIKKTALRETFEEVGIELCLEDLGKQYVVNYFNKNVLTKRVYCYLVKLTLEKEKKINLILQKEEVDSCSFYDREGALELVFWRFKELLKLNEIWI